MKPVESCRGVSNEALGPVIDRNFDRLARENGPYRVIQNYTFKDNDEIDSLQVDATNGNTIITLPSPTGSRRRRVIKVDASGNTVTVTSTALINGVSSHILSVPYATLTVEPTGTSWLIVAWARQATQMFNINTTVTLDDGNLILVLGNLILQAGSAAFAGGLITGDTTSIGKPSLATNATSGFVYIPACAGTPTGTPTTIAGKIPLIVDSTNNKLYFYSSGAWRDAGP